MAMAMAMAEDAGMFVVHQTIGCVLCCKCGILMQPNAANMRVKCLRSDVDITQGLLKRLGLVHCSECESYLKPPRKWVKLQLESKELLTFCLKKLDANMNANKVRMVNAEFIFTERHSKRVKVKVWVEKEDLNGAIIQQSYTVLYVQKERMCESCYSRRVQAADSDHQWIAAVQIRQHVSHRRTFFFIWSSSF